MRKVLMRFAANLYAHKDEIGIENEPHRQMMEGLICKVSRTLFSDQGIPWSSERDGSTVQGFRRGLPLFGWLRRHSFALAVGRTSKVSRTASSGRCLFPFSL